MTAKELYIKTTGNKEPNNQIGYDQWFQGYVKWLEGKVEFFFRIPARYHLQGPNINTVQPITMTGEELKDVILKAAEIGEVSMIDARHIVSLLDEACEILQSEGLMVKCMYCEKEVPYSSGIFTCKECSE
jgi:hypothetical protein